MNKLFTLYFLISSSLLYAHETHNLEQLKQKMSQFNKLNERLMKLRNLASTYHMSENKRTFLFTLASLLEVQILAHQHNLNKALQNPPQSQQVNMLLEKNDVIIENINKQMGLLRFKFSPFPFTR